MHTRNGRALIMATLEISEQEYEDGKEGQKYNLPWNLLPAHSMVFSVDSTRLLIACYSRKIHVVDYENIELLQ